MNIMPLEVFWFCVMIACLIGYAMLDGFDLGVGSLHLFVKKDKERRIFLNAIGPVWDGNEVWLVIFIGGLFAGFPGAYASLLSSFYTPVMALIASLIFRAVAIEFRSKLPQTWWRKLWDAVFCIGSLGIALGVGLALGNLVQGIPLDHNYNFTGSLSSFFHPYALLVAITTLALFSMHGSIYLVMKTEGKLHNRMRRWTNRTMIFFIIMYFTTTMATLIYMPHMVERFRDRPYLFFFALANMLAIANIPREMSRKRDGWAFLSSCASIGFLMILYGFGTFPIILRSTINPDAHSLHIYNSGASKLTLRYLAIIVSIGVPLVLMYGALIYRIFRGKVKIDATSY